MFCILDKISFKINLEVKKIHLNIYDLIFIHSMIAAFQSHMNADTSKPNTYSPLLYAAATGGDILFQQFAKQCIYFSILLSNKMKNYNNKFQINVMKLTSFRHLCSILSSV